MARLALFDFRTPAASIRLGIQSTDAPPACLGSPTESPHEAKRLVFRV